MLIWRRTAVLLQRSVFHKSSTVIYIMTGAEQAVGIECGEIVKAGKLLDGEGCGQLFRHSRDFCPKNHG